MISKSTYTPLRHDPSVMLNEAQHDLTLSAGADVPLLLQGEGQQGEVCYPHLVLLSEASTLDSSLPLRMTKKV